MVKSINQKQQIAIAKNIIRQGDKQHLSANQAAQVNSRACYHLLLALLDEQHD